MAQQDERKGLLTGKVAVVTGAESGIERATAIAVTREGAYIASIDLAHSVSESSCVSASYTA